MSMTVVKRFIADGNAAIIDFGFIPEYVRLHLDIDHANPDIIEWFKCMEDETTAQYGLLHTGSSGAITELTTAATGIIEYNSKTHGVLVPNPAGSADNFVVPTEYDTTANYSSGYTARSATAAGSCVWPTTRNGFVYELTTGTGTGTTEPTTWPTTVGETVTDGGSNVWTCRNENVAVRGVQGIQIGATTQTDGDVNIAMGISADHFEDARDAADKGANEAL